jgi:transposase-like protein
VNKEISQLIDVAVDTKYGSSTTNTAHIMTEALEQLNRKRETILHPRINRFPNKQTAIKVVYLVLQLMVLNFGFTKFK